MTRPGELSRELVEALRQQAKTGAKYSFHESILGEFGKRIDALCDMSLRLLDIEEAGGEEVERWDSKMFDNLSEEPVEYYKEARHQIHLLQSQDDRRKAEIARLKEAGEGLASEVAILMAHESKDARELGKTSEGRTITALKYSLAAWSKAKEGV